ncbi:MAG: copper amine oxidase N-terminal domain-containing protein [Alicyclobacillus sp.]|nr:copper amine oxidase N-terminal domain-containing protein [Alicyclobacillus sp.]
MKRTLTGIAAASMVLGTVVPMTFAAAKAPTVKWNQRTITVGSYSAGVAGFAAKDAAATTEYLPIYYVIQGLKKMGFTATWNGTTQTFAITAPSTVTVDLSNINAGQGTTSITLNGTLVQKATVIVEKDPASKVNTSYMPIYYVAKVLQRVGITSKYDGKTWTLSAPLAITSAKQTGASTIEVDFNKAVPSGTTLKLTDANGISYNVTTTWDSTGTVATLNTGYNLPAGNYTVTAGSLTASVSIATAVPTAITVQTSGFASSRQAVLNYSEVDQFGNPVPVGSQGNISIYAVDATTGTALEPTYGVGDVAYFDLSQANKGDNISVTITDSTNGISKTVTIPVVGISNVTTFTLGSATDNGSPNINTGDTAVLSYTAKDAAGNSITLPPNSVIDATYGNTIDGIEFLSSNPSVVDPTTFATDGNGNLTFKAGSPGTAIITAVDLATGSSSTATITVGNQSTVGSFKLGTPTTLLTANATTAIPYTATDGFGNAISQANFTSTYQTSGLSFTSSNPNVLPNDFNLNGSGVQNSANHIYFDPATNALEVRPIGSGTTTLYVYVNGTLQNSVTLNVQAQAYPAAITGTSGLSTYFQNVSDASETLSASNLNIINQYNQSYSPSSTDIISIGYVSGTQGLFNVAATTAPASTPQNALAAVYGNGEFTITPAVGQTGSETLSVTVTNPSLGKSATYDITLNDIATSSITSFSVSAPTTIYDTANGVFLKDPSGNTMGASNYQETVSLTGKTAGGQSVVLGSVYSVPAYITTDNSGVVSVVDSKTILGVGAGTANITAYDTSGNVIGTVKVTSSSASPVVTKVSADNTSSPSVSMSQNSTASAFTSAVEAQAGLHAYDQYGVQVQLPTGFWISSNSNVIQGGYTYMTPKAPGTAIVTYVSPNGIQTQLTVTVTQ